MNKFAAVITMDKNSNRFRAFSENNKHLQFKIFQGISGEYISKEDRLAGGFVTPELESTGLVSNVRLGTAMSHWSIWQEAKEKSSGVLIMEDDVMTHPQIWSKVEKFQNQDSFDIIFFSCNTDSSITMISPEGLAFSTVCEPKNPDPDWISAALARTNVDDSRYWKLVRAFGLCCYFVTPNGARKLIDSLFPLTSEATYVPHVGEVAGCAVDHRMNALYDNMNVFISMPFLAYTPHHNERAPK